MNDGNWTENTFSVEFGCKNEAKKSDCTKGAVIWTSHEEVLEHIGIVNYAHKDWYENHLSIYQHYRVWHVKCDALLAATDQNTPACSPRSRLSRAIIQNPLDTTPAGAAEILLLPSVRKMEALRVIRVGVMWCQKTPYRPLTSHRGERRRGGVREPQAVL